MIESKNKSFVRHVRRYVEAPIHRFAAIVPPDLAPLCRGELENLEIADLEISEAGVEFSGKLRSCYLANLWLRTASRILCRLPSFRAGAVEELFQKVSAVAWELWLAPGLPLQIEPYVETSRIEHEGLVEETVFKGIRKRFQLQELSAPPLRKRSEEREEDSAAVAPMQRLLIRLKSNRCEISLDTTGMHLHQRSYRVHHAGAPLRETLAAAILLKAGWTGETPLVDGMCGAGTFAIEAALMSRRLPPGLNRSFLFESWPSFQQKTWKHLVLKARQEALPRSPVPLWGIDRSLPAIAIAGQNAERAGVAEDVHWEGMDFFDFRPQSFSLPPGLLVLNPPYGKRLSGGGKALYERLGAHLREHFAGWRVAVLAPDRSLALGLRLPAMRFWNISHGGIPIVVVLAGV